MMPTPSIRTSQSKKTPIDTTLGHLPPQATDIEKVVLGALMIDCNAFSVVSELLHIETFYESRHQKIYQAILNLNSKNKPVDYLIVIEELKNEGTFDEVGGLNYILELTSSVASSANIEWHAHILAQKYQARQIISYASNMLAKGYDETQDIDELMQEAEASLFNLSQKNIRQDYTQIDPIVSQAYNLLMKAANNVSGITGVASGFNDIDIMTSGFQASDLIIIAGRPAMGKTSFALSIAKNISVDNRIPTAFFSLEMSNVQLINRLISNICSIPGNKILNGQLTQDEWLRFDSNIVRLHGAPLYVDETPNMSVFELRTKARRLVKDKDVKLIMIDYLQLMTATGMKYNTRQEEVSSISRSLKGLAKELNIPIIALSQLSRAVEQRSGDDGKRPQLSDLRESGAIEQDADMVMFVHRPEYYHIYEDSNGNSLKGKAVITIAKHRKGSTADITLTFQGEYTRFANPGEYASYFDSEENEMTYCSSGFKQCDGVSERGSDEDPLDSESYDNALAF